MTGKFKSTGGTEFICEPCSVKDCQAVSQPTPFIPSYECPRCGKNEDIFKVLDRMEVKLTYFKPSGKYYSTGEMEVPGTMHLQDIWDIVDGRISAGQLPGLIEGHSEFIVYIEVPRHPHNHPRIMNVDAVMSHLAFGFIERDKEYGNRKV